jgi:hypothetical protein
MMNERIEDPVVLTITDAQEFVRTLAEKAHSMIANDVMMISPKQRFVIMGRVLNFMVSHHFHMTMASTEEAIRKATVE